MSFKILFLCYLFFDLDKACSIDFLYNLCIILSSKLERLENKNFVLNSNMFFSDPECPFVFCVREMLNAINIILKRRQGTLESSNCYSKSSVFSFIVVLLNFCVCFLKLWYQLLLVLFYICAMI